MGVFSEIEPQYNQKLPIIDQVFKDAGSIPAAHQYQNPNSSELVFFLCDRACCPMLLRVRADTCGLCHPHYQAGSAPGSLSSGHFSLLSSRLEMGRSPHGPSLGVKQINNLRVDESIGFFPAMVGARNPDRINVTRNGCDT